MNRSIYLYQQGYISLKNTYAELKCFIKPFTKLETSSNYLNSQMKILLKILFYYFRLVESSFQSIKCSFWSIEQESNIDRFIQRLQYYFLTILTERAKALTNRKYWILNFHLKNSKTWIFSLWNNILQTQTSSLLQPIHVYTYIYNNILLEYSRRSNVVC